MNETAKKKSGWRIMRWSFWIIGSIALLRGVADLFFRLVFQEHPTFPTLTQKILYTLVNLLALAFLLYLLRPIFRLNWRWLFTWRGMRRILVGIAILATLAAIFYTEEDWRGKHAWENCKRELEAKGEVLDWNAYIPPPVPDDQNFFKAPKMQEWFVRVPFRTPTNELSGLSTNGLSTAIITNEIVATNYLKWSDQFQPQFEQIREALKRPYARMDGDYSIPYEIPIPNFIRVRALAQTLTQRAKCHLLLGQPDKALQELTLLHDMRHLLEAAPTGKPMTLVAAMINVAVTGLYTDTIAYGFQRQAWQEPQLAALQEQLADINLTPFVGEALKAEQASVCHTAEIMTFREINSIVTEVPPHKTLWQKIKNLKSYRYDLMPRGWIYQNMVVYALLIQLPIESFAPTGEVVSPQKIENAIFNVTASLDHYSLFKMLAAIGIPNFTRAMQTTAHNQTMVNEAQIVCALERYHLAHGEYPETLDALAPQFIEKIPHDIIGGQPLLYRLTDDGKFLLYSVGWNEKDDGGKESPHNQFGGITDYTHGDWDWKN
jgi:hypothetical protein